MKKSEIIQQMIDFEKQSEFKCTITLDYVCYLNKLKRAVEIGDIEI